MISGTFQYVEKPFRLYSFEVINTETIDEVNTRTIEENACTHKWTLWWNNAWSVHAAAWKGEGLFKLTAGHACVLHVWKMEWFFPRIQFVQTATYPMFMYGVPSRQQMSPWHISESSSNILLLVIRVSILKITFSRPEKNEKHAYEFSADIIS
jgi:hypothetical protein